MLLISLFKRHQEIIHTTTGIVDIPVFIVLLARNCCLGMKQVMYQETSAHLLGKDGQQYKCGQS